MSRWFRFLRRARGPGETRVFSVKADDTAPVRPPAFYAGQYVLVQPRKSEQPFAGPTVVRLVKLSKTRLVLEFLTAAEFAQMQAAETALQHAKRQHRPNAYHPGGTR